MTSVLVSHPHANANANGAAAAFAGAGRLSAYVTGAAAADGTYRARQVERLAKRLPIVANRILRGIRPEHLWSLGPLELAARLASRTARRARLPGPSAYDAMFTCHDAAVAMLPWPRGVEVVYAYEDGALRTFQRAARRDLHRIWDLPIPHYATLQRMWIDESRRWPGAMGDGPPLEPDWKRRRKDAELALATQVSVPSQFTRESLESAGVKVPVAVTPFGFPVEEFPAKRERPSGRFTVIAVGTQDLRKGTPYLLEAWKRAGLRDARLRLIGPMKLTPAFVAPYAGVFKHLPHVPRAHLGAEYRGADLLVLPTLGDGCPLVVQEAMCSGTPVVTTRCGNGPDCITTGVDGWVIPERDIDALVEALLAAHADRERTFAVGQAARARAERWTWADAGQSLCRQLLS